MTKKRICLIVLALILALPANGISDPGIIIVDSLRVTDVMPHAFSAVWATSEPATCSLNLFVDAEGTVADLKVKLVSESAEHPPAEDMGVMKVRAVGLTPNTSYFFQIKTVSKIDDTVSLYPSGPPFLEVMTEKTATIVENYMVAQKVSLDNDKPAVGMLLIASVPRASYPITCWVGRGGPKKWALINMDNFYDSETHTNLELEGDEDIEVELFGGFQGSIRARHRIPRERHKVKQLGSSDSVLRLRQKKPGKIIHKNQRGAISTIRNE